jgi:enoyl-CoA hydratase/carnithine racemase
VTAHRTIRVAVDGAVATITLHRPERLNAFTSEMGRELNGALRALDEDESVRAIVITGTGRAFCAGADLEKGTDTFALEDSARTKSFLPWNMHKPVIAAINGPAVGVGATLPLQWDIRIASDRAKIGFVFTRRGIVPEAMSSWILPRMIGFARASELFLTGRVLSAEEALVYGIVSRVVPHDTLMDAARELAREIASTTAPVAVAITKQLLWRQLMESDAARGLALEERLFAWSVETADAREGIASFLEKRSPQWTMKARADLPHLLNELNELNELDELDEQGDRARGSA